MAVKAKSLKSKPESFVNADFANRVLEGIDFSCKDLSGANFSNCTLKNCNFVNAHIEGANFQGAYIENCNFFSANLIMCNFVNVTFIQCWLDSVDFEKSLLILATIINCTCKGTSFRKADMEKIKLIKSDFISDSFFCVNMVLTVNQNAEIMTVVKRMDAAITQPS